MASDSKVQHRVSILGCGWLGTALAKALLGKYEVRGSTRTATKLLPLKKIGLESFLVDLQPELSGKRVHEFFESGLLIINFPPPKAAEGADTQIRKFSYVDQVRNLLAVMKATPVQRLLFVSSTSVYGMYQGEVSEDSRCEPDTDSGKMILEAEGLVRGLKNYEVTILRLGGLVGPGRVPGQFLAGQKDLPNGEAPIHLVHRDDCIGIIQTILSKEIWGETFNGVSDERTPKEEFYTQMAKRLGLTPPTFAPVERIASSKHYRNISNKKLKTRLGYSFIHPEISVLDWTSEWQKIKSP